MKIDIRLGVVDVLLLHRDDESWRVLVLRRGPETRCTGAWEVVHGRIEDGESPEDAAVREVREETGLAIERLYNVTVNPFYLHRSRTVHLAVVFAAVVDAASRPTLGAEHQAYEWVAADEALDRLAWPRERNALRDALHLLAGGDAGAVEDVLRVF